MLLSIAYVLRLCILATALQSYDLSPISYKPIPGGDAPDGASASGGAPGPTSLGQPSFNLRSLSGPSRGALPYARPHHQRRAPSTSGSVPLADYNLQSIAYKPTPGEQSPGIESTPPGPAAGDAGTQSVLTSSTSDSPRVVAPVIQQDNAKKKNATSTASAAKHAKTSAGASPGSPSTASTDDGSSTGCDVDPYDAPPVEHQDFPPYDQTTANVYRYRQQRAVNLGSWFVHENWMTPSLFTCAAGPKLAEIDIANGWETQDLARSVLERHWDTFIQESDFDYLANIGINTVRLPIGYWNLGPDFMQGTPFEPVAQVYKNSWARVVRTINLAGSRGLGVLVDLHGAVGSQNGQPHSGVSDGKTNLFDSEDYMQKTISVLTYLAQTLGYVNNVVGIQLLNEPQYVDGLLDFYSRTVDAIRNVSPTTKTMPLYLHDGFDLHKFADYVGGRTDFVVQDHHSYFVFSPSDQAESGSQHTVDVNGAIAKELSKAANTTHRNLVVDEWSCALTPQSLEKDNHASQVRKDFCTDQVQVYTNTSAGWSFWSYMKEDCYADPGWCFKAAVGKSLPSTFFPDGKAASMEEVNALAKNVSDGLIIPTITTEILNLIQMNMQSVSNTVPGQQIESRTFSRYRQRFRRFDVIHQRRDSTGTDGDPMTGSHNTSDDAMKSSTSKGYTDGFTTAKVFASYNMSQLGFVDQFMSDAIRVAGPTLIVTGTEYGYQGGFMQGLKHGEALAAGSQ